MDEVKKTEEDKKIQERKEKFVKFFRSSQIWVVVVLIVALYLGVYIRNLPLTNHGDHPGLWDITTNSWTLGPDLDPWLFTRYAKTIVETGSIPNIDYMRNLPLGADTSVETQVLPYMIAWTYYLLKIFNPVLTLLFAAAVFPVIMFALTIISFFLFVREIFLRKDKENQIRANIISLISTFFMIVVPVFLSRTVAGIPEKESVAFFFMFLSFYLFLKSWKVEKLSISIILSIGAGISTALMGLVWGGVSYIYIPIALSFFISFILNKVHKKEFLAYSLWVISAFTITILFTKRYGSLMGMLTSIDTGLTFLFLIIFVFHFIFWKTKISNIRILKESKIPKQFISLILGAILLIILISIFLGPSFIVEKLKAMHQMTFKPVTGRWSVTVAENRQPDFMEWSSSFGPFIKGIPIMFWLFFLGSVFLFRKMTEVLKKKDSWILAGFYVLTFFGMVFSRYSGSSIFNGENLISKLVYYGSVVLLFGFILYYYFKYEKENNKSFEKIDFEYLLLFSIFLLTLFTARGAVRLIMVLGPIASILLGFLVFDSIDRFRKTKEERSEERRVGKECDR
jgi:asparagine N-glycosylation enzyme membrane subunit Stt3